MRNEKKTRQASFFHYVLDSSLHEIALQICLLSQMMTGMHPDEFVPLLGVQPAETTMSGFDVRVCRTDKRLETL